MSLFDSIFRLLGKYQVNGIDGTLYVMKAEQLCDRVVEDSQKSNSNWIASIPELWRVCHIEGFPNEYAKQIEECILNCHRNLERENGFLYDSPEEKKIVEEIYNSFIKSKDEKDISVAKGYFEAILDGIIKYDHASGSVRFPMHYGPKYTEVCDNWKEAMIKEYFSDKSVNFDRIRRLLEIEFYNAIKVAEKKGVLAEEDEENYRAKRIKHINTVGEGKISNGLIDWTDYR